MIMRILLLIYAMSSSFIIGSQNKPAESNSNNSSSLAVSSIALVTQFDSFKKIQAPKKSWNLRNLLAGIAVVVASFSAGMQYEKAIAEPVIKIVREKETVVRYAVPVNQIDACRRPAESYLQNLKQRDMWSEYYKEAEKYCIPDCSNFCFR